MVNKKAKEDWDQKQAEEAEKLKKQNEVISLGIFLFDIFYYDNNWKVLFSRRRGTQIRRLRKTKMTVVALRMLR